MQSKVAWKFVAKALAALVFVLILAMSASVDAGKKNKGGGGGGDGRDGGRGGGGGGQAQGCPPPLVKKGGGCVMPGAPKPAKNIQQQQQQRHKQQQVDRPRGQDRKQDNKQVKQFLDTQKQGKPNRDGGKSFGDKQRGKDRGRGDEKFASPEGDGKGRNRFDGKNYGGKDRVRGDGTKTVSPETNGTNTGAAGADKIVSPEYPEATQAGEERGDGKKGGKDRDRDRGKHAGDKDGKDPDGKHAGDNYPGGKHDGKGKGPVLVECKHPLVWKKGKGCVRPGRDQAYCGWPMVRVGNSCVCRPGFISRHGDCYRPPVVVVVPGGPGPYVPEGPGYVPDGPGYAPVGPEPVYPEGPPPGVGPDPGPGGPPERYPPQQASPAPPPARPPAAPVTLASPGSSNRCLPGDLYDLLAETYGRRPGLDRCPDACLPKPASFTPAELDEVAAKSGIDWCDNCIQVGGYMPLASVLQIERAANVTLCVNPDMCRLPVSIGGPASGGEKVTEIRTVFKDLPAGAKNEGNIAVVVGNKDYQGDLPDNLDGGADADAVMALLIDQLGYKQENIIDLRDATLEDFERVFGSKSKPEGELAARIDDKDPSDVFIYIASHGMVKEDDAKQAYLLPVDAKLDDLDATAYPIQVLYEHLGKVGARTIMLMLEANFAKNLDELIDPPNLPELEVEAMPVNPVPGLAVFKASDRDQKTIKDPEYGIGLFTRYLIEGLAGRADEAPLGNDDKRIDTVELYVYTADAVRTAARKSFGLEQKPMLGKIDNLVVGQLSSN
jgi:hypothetical protein